MLDIALKDSGNGKLVFDWGPDGNPRFDETGAHAVLSTFFAKKGAYAWDQDGLFGTNSYKVVADKFATGSDLSAAGNDALAQCERDEIVTAIGATAERARVGSWRVRLRWHTPTGDQTRTVKL